MLPLFLALRTLRDFISALYCPEQQQQQRSIKIKHGRSLYDRTLHAIDLPLFRLPGQPNRFYYVDNRINMC